MIWIAIVLLTLVVTPGGIHHVGQLSGLAMIVSALVFVVMVAGEPPSSQSTRVVSVAGGLGVLVAVFVTIAHLHILWEGRALGYSTLLIVAAAVAPRTPSISTCAPESPIDRTVWYLQLLGLTLLTIGMLAEATALTGLAALGGSVLVACTWLPALLALPLISWPALKRQATGSLPSMRPDGTRRFRIRDLLLTLLLTSGAGWCALTGDRALGLQLGLLLGLLGSGMWELCVHQNVNVYRRGRGPLVWGSSVLLLVAGSRGLIISHVQPDPAAILIVSSLLIFAGVWIGRCAIRRVCGLNTEREAA